MKIAQRSRADPLGRDLIRGRWLPFAPTSVKRKNRSELAHRSPGTGLRLRVMRYLKPVHDALPSGETMFPAPAPAELAEVVRRYQPAYVTTRSHLGPALGKTQSDSHVLMRFPRRFPAYSHISRIVGWRADKMRRAR
jgi:hypothetical protein